MTTYSEHPDPNLLAALADGQLTAHERNALFDHLSICPTCRDLVILTSHPLTKRKLARAEDRWLLWTAITAAALAAFFTASLWHRQLSRSSAVPSIRTDAVRLPTATVSTRFEHLRLVPSGEPSREIGFLAHLIRKKPAHNQLVVFSPYGERWLTLDSTWSLPPATTESPRIGN